MDIKSNLIYKDNTTFFYINNKLIDMNYLIYKNGYYYLQLNNSILKIDIIDIDYNKNIILYSI